MLDEAIAIPQYIAEAIRGKLSEVVCKVENMLPEEMQKRSLALD